jgi:hypothetical protein
MRSTQYSTNISIENIELVKVNNECITYKKTNMNACIKRNNKL